MKGKKLAGLLLVSAVILTAATGCSMEDMFKLNPFEKDTTKEAIEELENDTTKEAIEKLENEAQNPEKESESPAEEKIPDLETSEEKPTGDIKIDETVLIDQKDVKLTVLGYEQDEFWDEIKIKCLLENNTDKDIRISGDQIVVNGYMIDGYLDCEALANTKGSGSLSLPNRMLKDAGIDTVKLIQMHVDSYDMDTYDDIDDFGQVEIRTNKYDKNFKEADHFSGNELYNGKGIRIETSMRAPETYMDDLVQVYIENESGKDISVFIESLVVNGFTADPFFSCDVLNGNKAINGFSTFEMNLEDMGIKTAEDVKSLEVSFEIREMDSFESMVITERTPIPMG